MTERKAVSLRDEMRQICCNRSCGSECIYKTTVCEPMADELLSVIYRRLEQVSEGMLFAGHVDDPLGCDVEEADRSTIYGRIYLGMLRAWIKEQG